MRILELYLESLVKDDYTKDYKQVEFLDLNCNGTYWEVEFNYYDDNWEEFHRETEILSVMKLFLFASNFLVLPENEIQIVEEPDKGEGKLSDLFISPSDVRIRSEQPIEVNKLQ